MATELAEGRRVDRAGQANSPGRGTGSLRRLRRLLATTSFHPRRRGPHDIRTKGVSASEVVSALESAWSQFVALLRDLDPVDGDRRVPHLEWTVSETAVHVLTTIRRGADPRRAGTVDDLGALNDLCIEEIAERDLHAIADLLDRELREARPALRLARLLWALRVGRWLTIKLHAGTEADFPTAASSPLIDLLVHGYDVATAVDRPWAIDPSHASVAVRGCLPSAWPWIHESVLHGPEQRVAVRLPDSQALDLRVGAGRFTSRPIRAAAAADATVDPVELCLALCGRITPSDPMIARISGWYRPI